jgi:hypothetical protein
LTVVDLHFPWSEGYWWRVGLYAGDSGRPWTGAGPVTDLVADLRFRRSLFVLGCRPFSASRGPSGAHGLPPKGPAVSRSTRVHREFRSSAAHRQDHSDRVVGESSRHPSRDHSLNHSRNHSRHRCSFGESAPARDVVRVRFDLLPEPKRQVLEPLRYRSRGRTPCQPSISPKISSGREPDASLAVRPGCGTHHLMRSAIIVGVALEAVRVDELAASWESRR